MGPAVRAGLSPRARRVGDADGACVSCKPVRILTTGAIDNRLNWTTRRSALTRGCRLVLEDGRTRCTPREERVRSGSDRGHLLRRCAASRRQRDGARRDHRDCARRSRYRPNVVEQLEGRRRHIAPRQPGVVHGRTWRLNEIYWPRVDAPQVRDLGFIVADGAGFWSEVKRDAVADVRSVKPGVPAIVATHRHPRYELKLRVCADDDADVVRIEATLTTDVTRTIRPVPAIPCVSIRCWHHTLASAVSTTGPGPGRTRADRSSSPATASPPSRSSPIPGRPTECRLRRCVGWLAGLRRERHDDLDLRSDRTGQRRRDGRASARR